MSAKAYFAAMKELCAACVAIVGQPPSIEPHDKLKTQSGHKLPFGWRESYVCGACGAGLQRVTVDLDANAAQGQAWSQFR
jgi:hypothetical protein